MFFSLAYRDTVVVLRGLLFFVLVVILGVSVSERQLNNLTQREEVVSIFDISCKYPGDYSIYILGTNYNMNALYSVGEIINNDKAIILKTANQSITIPTYIEFDCNEKFKLLDLWAKLLVDEGIHFKQSFELYLKGTRQKLNIYIRQFR